MTIKPKKNPMFQVVFAGVIVLLLAWYILICRDYPYYFIWDMDHISSLDTVLIHSGLLPDQMHHTGFGMDLFLFLSEKVAHFFGVLSAISLDELADSLNPLATMAELTDFVRLHGPFLAISIVVLLCMAVQVMFDMPGWYCLVFLIALGTQESLAYHSSMVRTELYSVFYWSCAVMTMVMATKAPRSISKWAWLLITGLLLGLCFLTKIQSVFYVAVLLIMLLLVFSIFQNYQKQDYRDITQKGEYWILAVSLFNIIAFLFLGIASHSTPIPRGIPVWASGFGVTPIAVFLFLALVLLFLCQLFFCLKNKVSSDIFRSSCFLSIIATGFILSFAFHFLLYSNAAVSLNYMLLDFKMLFLRKAEFLQLKDLSIYISDFLLYLCHNPVLFIVNITLNILLVLGYRFGFVRITKGQLALCLAATSLAFVNNIIGTRFILRDILWKEVLLNFLSLFYFAILVSRATRYRLTLARVGGGLLIVLFFANCIYAHDISERIDANYNHYGWKQDRWFSWVYGGNQPKYAEMMHKKYDGTTAWVAKTKAVEHKQIRRTVDFVFKNQAITHRNIGIVFDGFPVWTTNLDYRIIEVPPVLRGAILVDNAFVELKRNIFFKDEYIRKHSEYLDKFEKPSQDRQLSVLTRYDLKIFLFVEASDVSQLLSEEMVQTPYKIRLRNTKQSIELQGLEIKNYCEISLDKIAHKFFFVIRKT